MKCTNKCLALLTALAVCFGATGCSDEAIAFSYNPDYKVSAFRISGDTGFETADAFASGLCVVNGDINTDNSAVDMTDATSAGLFDLNSRTVLYAKNIHERLAPASLTKLMTAVYGDADALYELLKTSGKAAQTSEADAETEVRALLEAACKEFEGTFLQDVLRKEVTAHLIALFQKQMTIQRRSLKREAGRTDAERAARGAFAIDNRSRSVVVRNLADDVTERDVVNSLAGFFGVKNIQKEGVQATIEFDEPWQTKKPMQTGLLIGKSVGAGVFSHA